MKKKESKMYDRFRNLSICELLNFLINKETTDEEKEQIKKFIYENYEKSPQLEFLKSIEDLDKMSLDQKTKTHCIIVKQCIRDIIEALDIEHIVSLEEVRIIIGEKIQGAKTLMSM